jgi:uncharacterized membrane protein YfcA
MHISTSVHSERRNGLAAFAGGGAIGALGGLIGLGGAEFRLPLLIGYFGFPALDAVILNKATSLAVVASALPFRAHVASVQDIAGHWPVIVDLLTGSLLGAWLGADWATRIDRSTLHRIIAVLLAAIAGLLLFGHGGHAGAAGLSGAPLMAAGAIAGLAIGVVASMLGVAGGELLIPTLVLLFGVDVKLAGSLSLTVSLPTMLVGFARYSRTANFAAIGKNRRFLWLIVAGSLFGAFIGGRLLGVIPESILLPSLSALLLVSAVKMWRHGLTRRSG